MKRIGVFWLCFCFLLGLAACGEPAQPAEGTDSEGSSGLTVTSGDMIEIGWSDGAVEFSSHYLHTNGGKEGEQYPLVHVIRSAEELADYTANAGQDFDLRALSALGYDQTFFARKTLIFIVLEEPSSSNRHKVEQVRQRVEGAEKDLRVEISSIVPEAGDCAMAQWHILMEIPRDITLKAEDISVYKDGLLMKKKSPAVTYCFGTDSATTFSGEQAETLLGILQDLNYDPMKICRCAPQYQVKTEGETYGIHLEEGYVRCSAGQAELTAEQLNALRELHDWAKEQPSDLCGYPTQGGDSEGVKTTVRFSNGSSYSFAGTKSLILQEILSKLNYDPAKLCDCMVDYTVEMAGETYWLKMSGDPHAVSSKGQAELTEAQAKQISEIFDWAKKQPVKLEGPVSEFSFSLTWGYYGESSYDSRTGQLIKTNFSTHVEDYVTTYHLSKEQKEQVYALIQELDLGSYPDFYDPHEGKLGSDPSMTLVLSVTVGGMGKTVRTREIALGYQADNEKGQRFLTVCREISSLLMNTEAWKALPEYEFFYD